LWGLSSSDTEETEKGKGEGVGTFASLQTMRERKFNTDPKEGGKKFQNVTSPNLR